MGGSNPYIEEVKYKPATKKYKVTFLPSGKTIEVDPEKIPYGHNGLPGSILDISEGIKAGLDDVARGAGADAAASVVEAGFDTFGDVENAAREAVVTIGKFLRVDFDGFAAGKKCHFVFLRCGFVFDFFDVWVAAAHDLSPKNQKMVA